MIALVLSLVSLVVSIIFLIQVLHKNTQAEKKIYLLKKGWQCRYGWGDEYWISKTSHKLFTLSDAVENQKIVDAHNAIGAQYTEPKEQQLKPGMWV